MSPFKRRKRHGHSMTDSFFFLLIDSSYFSCSRDNGSGPLVRVRSSIDARKNKSGCILKKIQSTMKLNNQFLLENIRYFSGIFQHDTSETARINRSCFLGEKKTRHESNINNDLVRLKWNLHPRIYHQF